MEKQRNRFERWLDRHNHLMELMRTLFGFVGAVGSMISVFLLLKMNNLI